jgi:diketogulonate reductase-like aldo/keto reductase
MKYETIHNLQIPKIGFGCWTIGGHKIPDPVLNVPSLAALRSALDLGYTHFDTAEDYAAGHSEELLGQAIRQSGTAREALFITSKVHGTHLRYDAVLRACEGSLRHLGMDYIDLYLIHWPPKRMKLEETFRALNKLVADGKVKHLGVSNFDLKLLKESQAASATTLLTNQVPYSLADRSYVKNGVLAYCQANDILLTAYSPVKRRSIKSSKIRAIAAAKGITPQQIALAWLVQQPRVITIPMSFNPQHQAENLAAVDVELTADELAQLAI